MGRFDKYRDILSRFKKDIEEVATHQNSEIDLAKKEYNQSVLSSKIAGIKSEYAGSISSIRQTYLEQLQSTTDSMRSRNSGKFRENFVDFGLLEKFNIIAQSGVRLTASELEAFAKEAMSSRSSFCVRKCQLMAETNGFKLDVPSEEAANQILDRTDRRIRNVIEGYCGAPSGQVSGHYMMLTVDASGIFIDRLEKEYESSSVEDISIGTISPDEYRIRQEKAKKEKSEQGIEITEVGHLGIRAKDVNTSSYAAEYARRYSARMAQPQPDEEG